MKRFLKYIPMVKVVETATGTLIVYGQVTAEDVDSDRESCDYEGTKPFYAAKVEQMRKATTELGVEPNIMPLREMHNGDKSSGRGVSIEFNDAAKRIMMGFEVVDPLACQKVRKGMYPGFSQGGDYVDKWADPVQKGVTRYIADPIEVSLVDAPACPTSLLSSVSEFEYEKADGSKEMRKFAKTLTPAPGTPSTAAAALSDADVSRVADALVLALQKKDAKTKRVGGKDLTSEKFAFVGDPEDTSTWKLPIHDAAHVRNALARFNQTQGIPAGDKAKVKAKIVAAAKEFGIEVADETKKLQAALDSLKKMQKGMYQVGEMARIIEDLTYLQQSSLWERDYEQDDSVQPEELMALLEDAINCFLSMAEEEAGEVANRAKESTATTVKGEKSMKPETLEKAIAMIEKAKNHAAAAHAAVTKAVEHHEKMHKLHKEMADMHEKMSGMHKSHAELLGKAAEHTQAMCDAADGEKAAEPGKTGVQEPAAAPAAEPPITKADIKSVVVELVKTEVATAVEGALVKALAELQKADPNDPANKTRMTLVPRPGDPAPVAKGSSAASSEAPTGTMKDNVGF